VRDKRSRNAATTAPSSNTKVVPPSGVPVSSPGAPPKTRPFSTATADPSESFTSGIDFCSESSIAPFTTSKTITAPRASIGARGAYRHAIVLDRDGRAAAVSVRRRRA
jgi:hypothetical protein